MPSRDCEHPLPRHRTALDPTFEFTEIRTCHEPDTERDSSRARQATERCTRVPFAQRDCHRRRLPSGERSVPASSASGERMGSISLCSTHQASGVCVSVVDERGASVTDLSEPAAPWAESTRQAWKRTAHSRLTSIVASGEIAAIDAPRLAVTPTGARSHGACVAIDKHGESLRTLLADVCDSGQRV